MNKAQNIKISCYADLLNEKVRLERLIENQKNIVRHDFDELKLQIKKEVKPALDAASFIKKIAAPKKRNKTLVTLGANVAIDLLVRSIFPKSNFLFRYIAPKLLKGYATNFLSRLNTVTPVKKSSIYRSIE